MTDSSNPLDLESLLAHGGFVRNVARGLVLDENAVDDIVQETFLRALRAGPSRGGRLSAWLRSVARNVALSTRRAEISRQKLQVEAEMTGTVLWPEEILQREELRRRVVDAVFALDEPYRTAILLRHYEELTPEAMAERLDIPVGTVWTRLHRGRGLLRTKLAKEYEGNRSWMRGLVVLSGVDTKVLAAETTSVALGAKAIWVAVALLAAAGLLPVLWVDSGERPQAFVGSSAPAEGGGDRSRGDAGSRSKRPGEPSDVVRLAVTDSIATDAESAISCRVVDPTGKPIGHAEAYARVAGTNEPWSAVGHADSDGLLAIEQEDPRPLDLEFRADSFIPVRRSSVLPESSLEVILLPGIMVNGQVVDAESDAPVAGASVRASLERFAGSVQTETDDSGFFSITLPRFCFSLRIEHSGYPHWKESPFQPDPESGVLKFRLPPLDEVGPAYIRVLDRVTQRPIEGVEILPGPAKPTGGGLFETICQQNGDGKAVNIRAPGYVGLRASFAGEEGSSPDNAPLVQLSRAITLTGSVVNALGEPVEEVLVQCRRRIVLDSQRWPDTPHELDARTDGEGRFELRGLAPANLALHRLSFRHADYVDLDSSKLKLPETPPYELPPVRLERGNVLRGRVLRSEDRSVIPGARVTCGSRVVTTGEDGIFVFEHLAGRVKLVARADGLVANVLDNVEVQADTNLDVPLREGLSISGSVVDAQGRPAAGAAVRAVLKKSELQDWQPRNLLWNTGLVAWSDAQGQFRIDGLIQGSYALTAGRWGAPSARRGWWAFTTQAAAGDDDVRVRVEVVSGVIVRLVSARTGQPIRRFSYQVEYSNRAEVGQSGRGIRGLFGNNAFFEELSPGSSANLMVEAPDHAPFVINDIRVGEAEILEIEASLQAPSSLEGVIRDQEGRRLADVTLRLALAGTAFRDSEPLERTARTDQQGRYKFDMLGVGTWQIRRAEVGRYGETLTRSLTVNPSVFTVGVSGPVMVDLVAETPEGATLQGKVTPPPDDRITELLVALWREGEYDHPYAILPIDTQGRYRIPSVPAGRYSLGASIKSATGGGGTTHENVGVRWVDVPTSGEVEADLDIGELDQYR